MANEWIKTKHPLYEYREAEWVRNELRMRGGWEIQTELRRFDWETVPGEVLTTQENKDVVYLGVAGEHYESRQRMAVYVNFMDSTATQRVGHLFKKGPAPDAGLDFGALGEVRRERDRAAPTKAELLYYNTDGVGNDGSQWDNFWSKVVKWTMATGHRWLGVEVPRVLPGNREFRLGQVSRRDEALGFRPYLYHRSPLAMTNWHYEQGRLAFCVWLREYRRPSVQDGSLEGNEPKMGYRLMVRAGFAGLGPLFAGGGWWDFDEDTELTGASGDWTATDGEIPVWPHFYERDDTYFSRAGLTELGNAAVQYMNIDSAATFDAWDAAASVQYVLGAEPNSFNTVINHLKSGSKLVPVPINPDTSQPPQIFDGSTGAVTSQVFTDRLDLIRKVVQELESMEMTSVPESSGVSKQVGFAEGKSPRLALMASECEGSMNTALYYAERLWGEASASASCVWTRDFDLVPALDQVTSFFELENLAGIRSPTADAMAMARAVKEAGITSDDSEVQTIENEYAQAATQRRDQQEQEAALTTALLTTPNRNGAGGAEE